MRGALGIPEVGLPSPLPKWECFVTPVGDDWFLLEA